MWSQYAGVAVDEVWVAGMDQGPGKVLEGVGWVGLGSEESLSGLGRIGGRRQNGAGVMEDLADYSWSGSQWKYKRC